MIPNTNDPGFYEGRDFNRIGEPLVWTAPRSKLTQGTIEQACVLNRLYVISLKLDDKFVRVIKKGTLIRMITSGGRDFYHNGLARYMERLPDGQYNMGVIYKSGALGELHSLGYLTVAYTQYKKQLPEAGDWVREGSNLRFVLHDYLMPCENGKGYYLDMAYKDRRNIISAMYLPSLHAHPDILTVLPVEFAQPNLRYKNPEHMIKALGITLGYNPDVHEGLVLQDCDAVYKLPRTHTSYKVKNVEECKGTIIDAEDDKNQGNGTLIVLVDGKSTKEEGLFCRVSSGIDSYLRSLPLDDLKKLRVEVEYERIAEGGEYLQPRLKRYYRDKSDRV